MKSFLNLASVPIGFDRNNLVTFQIRYSQGDFVIETGQTTPSGSMLMEMSPRITLVSERIRERLLAIPGVEASTVAVGIPIFPFRNYNFSIEGRETAAAPADRPAANWYPVLSDYLKTLRIPVVRGRDFGPQDVAAAPPVALINQTAAKKYWPNEDPIGKRIQINFFNDQPRQIVGVVGDVRTNLRDPEQPAQMYVPYGQLPIQQEAATALGLEFITFLVRSDGNLDRLVPAMRSAVAEIDRTQAFANMRPMDELLYIQLFQERIYSILLSVFGGIAVLLALVGIYGIMSHSVSQRVNEIGVRVALGASRSDVLLLVLRRGLFLIGIGTLLGLFGSFAITRVVRAVLFGVTPTDPLTLGFALLVLISAGFVACYIPARRAVRIDPVIALRCE
jgi:predicted permease